MMLPPHLMPKRIPFSRLGGKETVQQEGQDRDNFHRRIGARQHRFYTDPAQASNGVVWDIQGIIGEKAPHDLFGIPWKHEPERISNPYDILLNSGLRGECKYGSKHGHRFGLDERYSHHFDTWDVGILVYPSVSDDIWSDPEVIGFIWHDQWWSRHKKRDWGHGGLVHYVELAEMLNIELLIDYENRHAQGRPTAIHLF